MIRTATGVLLLLFALPASAAAQSAGAAEVAEPTEEAAPAATEQPRPHPYIAVSEPGAAQSSDDDWSGSVAVYGFLSGFDGELRARDRVVEVERGFSEITDVLKFAVGLRLEAQHEKWGFAFDNNYLRVGGDVETDRAVVPDFRFDLSMNVAEVEPSYRIFESGEQDDPVGGPKLAVDVIGGVRIVHLGAEVEFRRLIADDVVRDTGSTYVHGYIGNEVIVAPSKYVSLSARYNLALASDFSWFVGGFVDIRPWKHFSIGGGLQALDLSLEEDSKEVALDARFFGPTVNMKFHF